MLAKYKNGNYTVELYEDGTKVKQTEDDFFDAEFPDSMDLKITNYCDLNCPMCHEKSSTLGKHADLNANFLSTLRAGTELAIGGGNPLSHPDLIPFLERMKKQGVICNLTINEKHFLDNIPLVHKLATYRLIYGLGISLNVMDEDTLRFARLYPNTVFHVINGLFMDYDKLFDRGYKILILGYKQFGRGKDYYNKNIELNMEFTKKSLPDYLDKFSCISFDNLALKQLAVKDLVSKETFDEMYMGEDGEGTMYVDLVEKKFALSSTSEKRFDLLDNIGDMFQKIKKTSKNNNEVDL